VSFGLLWILPFAGLLLSIAVIPSISAAFWQRHYGKVSLFWALAFTLPFAAAFGFAPALGALLHTLLRDFAPFAILLTALYGVAGGIRLTGTIRGTPAVNTLLLLIGALIANVMGTTGAAMVMVRPLIRANRRRRRNAHIFVFFIFLVANVGGALTPLGNPPLLIGFLEGVPFFWPTVHLFLPTALLLAALLGVFYLVDRRLHRGGWRDEPPAVEEIERLGVDGKVNIPLLTLIPAVVLLTGLWRSQAPQLPLPGLDLDAATLLGNLALVAITLLSLRLTRPGTRRANEFSWRPMIEVAEIFAAIFVTIIPAVAIMRAGAHGPLAPLTALIAGAGGAADAIYFWAAGALSSPLGRGPAYLPLFNFAGGDPAALTGPLARTLAAISAGAVYLGAATYVGNAPNFMVRAVCEERGIRMPSFFGYSAWAAVVLLPLYALVTLIFYR
jgi:Na+/H+ antiporter NhaD/arsenite permease-like protein